MDKIKSDFQLNEINLISYWANTKSSYLSLDPSLPRQGIAPLTAKVTKDFRFRFLTTYSRIMLRHATFHQFFYTLRKLKTRPFHSRETECRSLKCQCPPLCINLPFFLLLIPYSQTNPTKIRIPTAIQP